MKRTLGLVYPLFNEKMKIKQHLQKYIGWYFLMMSIWMMFQEGYGTEGFIIFFITLMKVPPFDLVGRMFDWVENSPTSGE